MSQHQQRHDAARCASAALATSARYLLYRRIGTCVPGVRGIHGAVESSPCCLLLIAGKAAEVRDFVKAELSSETVAVCDRTESSQA